MTSLFGLLELQRQGPARTFVPEPYSSAAVIRFASGDSVVLTPGFAHRTSHVSHLTSGIASSRYVLVHLPCPVNGRRLAELVALGLEPVGYLAYQNVVCRRSPASRAALPDGWTMLPFRPEFKLAPELAGSAGSGELTIALWPGEPKSAVCDSVRAWQGTVLDSGPASLRVRLGPGSARRLAALDGVSWVQEPDPVSSLNREAQWVLQSGWRATAPPPSVGWPVWDHGLRGQNIIIGLADAGILTDHDQFADPQFPLFQPGIFPNHRKIVGYRLYRNASFGDISTFHGTSVAGTLAGNDSVCGNSSKNDGHAPDARIFFLDVATASGAYVFGDDLTDLLDSVRLGYLEPVRQTSGSWGSESRLGFYRMMDATLDAVAWRDKNFLAVWAAGNSGPVSYNIGHPGCAKNCLTVGACGDGVQANYVASFSSRGPTRDNRIKPEFVTPGEKVTSADGPAPSAYLARNGTSLSAPAASAALALVRQYLTEGFYPAGRPDSARRVDPSSALLRALAVTGTDQDLVADPIPNPDAGWGRLNLSSVLHFAGDSVEIAFVDDSFGLAGGEFHEYRLALESRRQLKVALAWTDTAGSPESEVAIVNDLDLELVAPDQNGYRGNQFSNGQSRANPESWDERNVLEHCLLKSPVAGAWTLRVRARNVFTERQPYALTVRADLAEAPAVAEPAAPGPRAAARPALFATGSHPARLLLRRNARLIVFAADGRAVSSVTAASDGVVFLNDRGNRLAPGVYCYRILVPGDRPVAGRLLVAD